MVSDEELREVDFETYCKTCKYEKRPEEQIPCCDCLEEPLNLFSQKPVKWEAKDKGKAKSKGKS